MASDIISFRPTPDVRKAIEEVKREGRSVSKWLNELVLHGGREQSSEKNSFMQFRFIPEEGALHFHPEEGLFNISQKVALQSTSVSRLCARQYDRFRKCLQREGLQFFSNSISGFGVVQMVAVNAEEANVEFQKFFRRNEEGAYVRTELPLPTMRYDSVHDVAIICYIEPL